MSLLDPEFFNPETGQDPRADVGSGRVPLDVLHHDQPERHTIGKTMLQPNLVKPVGATIGDATPGKSLAPAREDHVHGPASTTTAPYPLGRIAIGSVLNLGAGTNIAAGSSTDLTDVLTFTPTIGRRYRVCFVARAFGPQTTPGNATLALRLIDSGGDTGLIDHWYAAPYQWGSIWCAVPFSGDGNTKAWKIRTANVAIACISHSSEFYIEDIGKV